MTENAMENDDELLELRRRRVQEILDRRTSGGTPPPAADPTPTELRSEAIRAFLSEHPRVVVDVWAPWCAPCRMVAPVLDGLARKWYPKIRFAKVNADEEPLWTTQWGVSGIPTLLLFQQSRLVDRLVGAYPATVMESRFRSAFRLDGDGARTEGEDEP